MTPPKLEPEYINVPSTERSPKRFGLMIVYAIVGFILIVGTSLSYLSWRAGVHEVARISESIAQEEYLQIKSQIDINTFYPGISVEGVSLGGLTQQEASQKIAILHRERFEAVAILLQIDDQTKTLTATDIGWRDDMQAALDLAWQYGRTSDQPTDMERINDRLKKIQNLQSEPINFKFKETYEPALAVAAIRTFLSSQQTTAKSATAIGFDFENSSFIIDEKVIGRRIDPQIIQDQIMSELGEGHFQAKIAVESVKKEIGMTREELQTGMALIATANTFAYKADPERDNNLLKACEYLNGTIVQPGATFSFNETVGQRTAERGFLEAGAISDGILKKELGGGVCQVNTTVMQATMKSDFELVERYPHSWPSSYTKIGLDAAVDWGSVDYKFTNNSDYPVAIVAVYIKPKLTIKVYGRRLEEGVAISLRSEETEVIPAAPPKYIANNTLSPGQVDEIRAPHDGKRAVTYKVYKKGTQVLSETVLFKSYYRPIQGLYEVGPVIKIEVPFADPKAPEIG